MIHYNIASTPKPDAFTPKRETSRVMSESSAADQVRRAAPTDGRIISGGGAVLVQARYPAHEGRYEGGGLLRLALCLEGAERLTLLNTCGHIEVSPVFDLTMVWNKGVSFGLLGADGPIGRWLLVVFSVLVALGLIAGLLDRGPIRADRRLQGVAFGFIIGGALGNAIDRAAFGAVVDFLNFSDVYFPYVFNVADVGINLGVAAIVLDVFLNDLVPSLTKECR